MSLPHDELIDRNWDLIGRFVGAVIDDFSLADGIPSKATLVLLPDDDPELAALNQATADHLIAEGTPVHVVHVAAAPSRV